MEHKDTFLSPGYEKQYDKLRNLYYSSQFVQKKDPVIITDEMFRSFAGGAFLKGLNPILIVHDHPPLGNYIISLSIFLFDNPRTIMIPVMIAIGFGIFLIAKEIFGNSLLALIPMGIFINEPIFTNKMIYAPLVEPIQLPFILFAFYFFIRSIREKRYVRWFVLTSLFLGAVISTRFFVTGGVMTFCMILYLLYTERKIGKKLILFILLLPISLVILILSYTRTIIDGYSIVQIFGIQKYILAYHSSKLILPFSFWDLMLFNRWHTWWGDWKISSDPQWMITWPVSTVFTFTYLILTLFKKIKMNHAEKFISLWLIIYTLSLSTGFSSTNYFMSIIPFFYILGIAFLRKTYLLIKK